MDQPSRGRTPILLVEDSPTDCALIARVFPTRLTFADGPEAALDAVRRHSFAVILLAQALPRRSGLDLLRELRAQGDVTPVVLLTESDDEGVAADALRDGALDCIVKQPGFEAAVRAAVARAEREALSSKATEVDDSNATDPGTREQDATRDILLFELDGECHGVAAEDVEEVVRAVSITPLPHSGAVEGVIDVRGRVVPVVNVRSLLGLPPKAAVHTDHLIVVKSAERLVALRTDRATMLTRGGTRAVGSASAALVRTPEGLVVLHDTPTLVAAAGGIGTDLR